MFRGEYELNLNLYSKMETICFCPKTSPKCVYVLKYKLLFFPILKYKPIIRSGRAMWQPTQHTFTLEYFYIQLGINWQF